MIHGWQSYKILLQKLVMKFNTPILSSAPVEKLFSYAIIINLSRYHKFSDNMLEKKVILKSNLNKIC